MVNVTCLLAKAGSRVGFSFGVRAWTEVEIWCIKGMYRLKLISSEKYSGFKGLIKSVFIFILSFTIALTPDPVLNLTASVDAHKPAVTLNWDPPANAGYPGDVTKYQVRFWDKEKGCYNESIVDGSSTTTIITRESGLRPLTETTFEVRACSSDDASQKWRTVSAFVGM